MGKRILVIVNEYTAIVNFRREVVAGMVAAGNTVAVAVPPHERVAEIAALGAEVLDLDVDRRSTNPLKDLRLLRDISRLLKAWRPDMVFTFTIKPNIYGGLACGLAGIPRVSTITGLGSSIQNRGPLRRVSLALYRIGLRGARKVFFQNESNRRLLADEGVYRGDVEMIPGSGVNLDRYQPQPYPGPGVVRLLFVGRVMRDKGIEEFFQAAGALAGDSVEFHICGPIEDDYRDRLQQLADSGTVHYHGQCADMRPWYAMAHGIVLPSYHEGMANVLLEAAASGRPLIASDIPGCREAIGEGTGFTVTPRDAAALTETLRRFIALPHAQRAEMGRRGRLKMEREFDRGIVVERYVAETR